MKKLIAILIMAIAAIQMVANSQDFAAARKMCENYGFIPNTAPFAQCVQTEVNKSKDAAEDSKQNEACLNRVKQIKQSINSCSLSCSINYSRNYDANMACTEKCETALNFAPICKK